MKKIVFKILAMFVLFAFQPNGLFANNNTKINGISDLLLLTLMLGVIFLLLMVVKAIAGNIQALSKMENRKPEETNSKTAKVITTLVLLGTSFSLSASNGANTEFFVMSDSLFWVLTAVIIFLAVVILILFKTLKTLIRVKNGESFEEEEETVDIFQKLNLTDGVAIEEEDNIMLDHEYDGIRELDNNLPPWWKYMFYGTIIFSLVYIFRYHISSNGMLSQEEYAAEMLAAEEEKASAVADAGEQVNEETVEYLIDEASLTRGAALFKGNCVTCHGALGEGGAGPNLTDEYWIHGGGISKIFTSIKYGIPAKGMIAWQSQFNPSQIQQISSYVLSLQGTNPPNGKSPQGEKWVEQEPTVLEVDSAR